MIIIKGIVLCAGFATRLYPLTLDMPKPLLPIAGKPIIEWILPKIEEIDEISEILIVTNQRFYNNFRNWKRKYSSSKPIKILNDKTTSDYNKLGAVGDIDFAVKNEKISKEDLLVVAGDNLFDFELKKLLNLFNEKKASIIALYDVRDKGLIRGRYGAVVLDKNNKVINIEEKPLEPKTTLASTACYIISKEDVAIMEGSLVEHKKLDNLGELIRLLAEKGNLYGLIFNGKWFDIGDKQQLREADKEWSIKR